MNIQVFKFGGTSVKNLARIEHVARIVSSSPIDKKIVVVSAMGDTTDNLLRLGKQCARDPDKRELDLLLATGELVSAALLALTLQSMGVRARAYSGPEIGIETDDNHGDARILGIERSVLERTLESNDVIVVAGFQGRSPSGAITTLGRGGSDTTAVAIAAAVGANSCLIYSDVDGICTSDPNKVTGTRVFSQIAYEEAASLARAGASVIHPRAVDLAQKYKIQIQAGNTFKPDLEGTIIKEFSKMEQKHGCYAVALSEKEASIRLSKVSSSQSVADVISGLIGENLKLRSLYHKEQGDTAEIVLDVSYEDKNSVFRSVEQLKERLACEHASINLDIARISLIGPAIAADRFAVSSFLTALKNCAIDTRRLECSGNIVSCLVQRKEAQRACQIVHDVFHKDLLELREPISVTA